MRDRIEKLKRRFEHPYTKAAGITAFTVVALWVLALVFLLPHANHSSVQAGLTIVAEILGVLLGAILVVIGFLTEQSRQAKDLLVGASQKYRALLEEHLEEINAERQGLVKSVKAGRIQLDDPHFKLLDNPATNRTIIGTLSTLIVILSEEKLGEVIRDLMDLGYTQAEKNAIQSCQILASHQPETFLRLVENALTQRFFPLWSSGTIRRLAFQVSAEYTRDGIHTAFHRLETSRRLLKSKTLTASMVVVVLATVGAVMTLFGITEQTVGMPIYIWLVRLVVTFFLVSVLLALFLIEKMLV